VSYVETFDSARSTAALPLGLAASAAFAADKPVYGVLMKTLSNPFLGAMEKGVDVGAKNAGVDIFLDAVESDQAAEPHLNACNTMLQKKPAALITAAINSTILLPCLKQANEMRIPAVDLDNNLDPTVTKKAGVDVAVHIGSDNEAAGAKGADYPVSLLGKDAKGPVLVIRGWSDDSGVNPRRARLMARALRRRSRCAARIAHRARGSLRGDGDAVERLRLRLQHPQHPALDLGVRRAGDRHDVRHLIGRHRPLGRIDTRVVGRRRRDADFQP